jgi:predicted RNA-binding Zn-ribbon protein involved in translation (DUF1610 family)
MSDLINLACPSCGASLQVGKEILRAKCPYCGRESIVKPTENILEFQSRCPICHRNDRTKKVSAIMSSTGENKAFFAIPPKPSRPPEIVSQPPLQSPTMGLIKSTNALRLAFIGAWLLAGISFLCAISNSNNITSGIIFLILFGVAGFVLFRQYNKEKQRNTQKQDEHRQQLNNYQSQVEDYSKRIQKQKVDQEELYQKWIANWQIAVEKWKLLYYCERDDCVFIPGQEKTAPLKDIEKFCYQKD